MLIPTGQLLCNVEYMELDEISYKKALFEMIIDKDVEYNKITITKPVDKYTKTKNEKDKGTIIDAEVEVSQVWVVKNGLGLTKAYNNKEKAILNNERIAMKKILYSLSFKQMLRKQISFKNINIKTNFFRPYILYFFQNHIKCKYRFCLFLFFLFSFFVRMANCPRNTDESQYSAIQCSNYSCYDSF